MTTKTFSKEEVGKEIRKHILDDLWEGEDHGKSRITDDFVLSEHNFIDQTDSISIIMHIEEEYDLNISDEDEKKLKTIKDFTDYVSQKVALKT